MNLQQIAIADLQLDKRNARRHPERNRKATRASLDRFGQVEAIVVQASTMRIVGGNCRVQELRDAGEVEVWANVVDLTDREADALAIALNRTADMAEWEPVNLQAVLADIRASSPDEDLHGVLGAMYSDAELDALLAQAAGKPGKAKPSDVQDPGATAPPAQPDSEVGAVYALGPHRLLCGDSTSPAMVARLFDPGQRATLITADPPYGMGKEADGVENDNLYKDKLDTFQMAWWKACRPHLVDNGSAYIWGNAPELWRLWYRPDGLAASERLTFRNEIAWDKESAMGMRSEGHRQFATATERCLFFMVGEQGFGNVNTADYWEGFEPIRGYLAEQIEIMGWGPKDVKRLTGTSMFSHWFTKAQWSIIHADHYATLQAAAEGKAFSRPYAELRALYDGPAGDFQGAKEGFYGTRAYFDNVHDSMTDVWRFGRVLGEDRHGHATPKPVEMVERSVKSSSPVGSIVLEPFAGSGSTLIACARTERVCYTIEISPAWCDVVRRRATAWLKAAGIDPGSGALE